jgi:hypothetical protein
VDCGPPYKPPLPPPAPRLVEEWIERHEGWIDEVLMVCDDLIRHDDVWWLQPFELRLGILMGDEVGAEISILATEEAVQTGEEELIIGWRKL